MLFRQPKHWAVSIRTAFPCHPSVGPALNGAAGIVIDSDCVNQVRWMNHRSCVRDKGNFDFNLTLHTQYTHTIHPLAPNRSGATHPPLFGTIRSARLRVYVYARVWVNAVLRSPLCPQLSAPANDRSRGGCWGTGVWKLKQTFVTPNTTCVAAVCRASPFRTNRRERHLIVMNINDGNGGERWNASTPATFSSAESLQYLLTSSIIGIIIVLVKKDWTGCPFRGGGGYFWDVLRPAHHHFGLVF